MTATESELRTSKMAWALPEVETIEPGVHRIPLPLPMDALVAVNVYVIETGDGLILIDGGWAVSEGRERLNSALIELGLSITDIAEILVSHMHRDHYTLGSVLHKEIGGSLRLGRGEAESLALLRIDARGGDSQYDTLREAGAGQLVDAWREWLESQPADTEHYTDPSSWLEEDDFITRGGTTLRAVRTPGHTRGHFVFIDYERGLLFSGDHLLPTITPSVGFEPARDRLALQSFMESLAKVRDLGDFRMMPAHGPAGTSTRERAEALITHHDERLEATLAQVDDGETAYKVASYLRWTRRGHAIDDLEPYNQALAVMETQYHLQLLEERGILRSRIVDGVRLYQR